jgi:hypothetical protein
MRNKEPIPVGTRFYDNKGKLINQDISGNLFDFGLVLTPPGSEASR